MNIYLRKLAALFLAPALLVQACAPFGVRQPQPKPVTLRVILAPFLSFAPFFIAEEEGYFAEQGIEIEFVRVEHSSEAIPFLAQGELDVLGGPISVGSLNAMAGGGKIKLVADKGNLAPAACTYDAFVARPALVESGELYGPAQLKGQRIAMDPVSFEGYFVEKLLNEAGLTLDDIETEDVASPALFEALEKGRIDLVHTAEPWLTRILQAGHGVVWMPMQQVLPDFQYAFIMYGPTLLQENPDAGKRFMVAYLKAVRQYNQGKTERNLEILAKYTELDQELLRQACWPSIHDDGQINVQSVLDFQAWALEKGYLDSSVTEEQFWDPSFVEYANQVLETTSQ